MNWIFDMMEKTSYTADDIYNLDYSFVFAWEYKNTINANMTDELNN